MSYMSGQGEGEGEGTIFPLPFALDFPKLVQIDP